MMDTRQKIIDAAIVVLNDDFSAPLEKVADKATVTRRTLHRYFKDRNELLACCAQDMQVNCSKAMADAWASSANPLIQLEQILYAAVNCGIKYAALYKLHHAEGHRHEQSNRNCAEFDMMYRLFEQLVLRLQEDGFVDKQLTVQWVYTFFTGLVQATVQAEAQGTVAKQSLKQFAWFSFSKGIGL